MMKGNKILEILVICLIMEALFFSNASPSEDNNAKVVGIDVSHWQGDIDWFKVYNAGYRFAFVKATQGTLFKDPNFETNMEKGRDAGMLMGAYHFAEPNLYLDGEELIKDAEDEARHFINIARNYLKEGYLRPALDIEDASEEHPQWGVHYYNPSTRETIWKIDLIARKLGAEETRKRLSSWINKWMTTVEAETGIKPILYVNSNYAKNYLQGSMSKYNLWIAHYTEPNKSPDTGIWNDWDFWQYSRKGSVPGIKADVDLDLFNGDIVRLYTFRITFPISLTNVDVVLVIDVSGSMGDVWKGEKKLDSAKKSATAFIDVMLPPTRVAIVTFQTNAYVNLGFTSDFNSAKNVISKLYASGATNIGDALKKALNELETNGRPGAFKAIVFFTDGHITTGITEEEVLRGPVQEAVNKKVVIYAIGYGDPSYLREGFLRRMAEATGGKYYYATETFELQNHFIESGLKATNWKIEATFNGTVKQGETVDAGSVYVLPDAKKLRIILNWPGSDLDFRIVDPTGKELDPTSPTVVYSGNIKPEHVMVDDPQIGKWTIKVYGKSVPSEEPFRVWVATYVLQDLTLYRYIPLIVISLVFSIACFVTWHALSLPTQYKNRLKQLKRLETLYREGKISPEIYNKLMLELENESKRSSP
jgi:lysozyme